MLTRTPSCIGWCGIGGSAEPLLGETQGCFRARVARRLAIRNLLVLSLPALVVAVSCVDEPGNAPVTQDPPARATGGEYPHLSGSYSADCGGYQARLRDCGILTEGVKQCSDPEDDTARCIFECLSLASCQILANVECESELAYPLSTCFDACATFECNSGESIPALSVCDGLSDCVDGSDEAMCQFECGSGELLPASYQCDFYADCADGSDELGCQGFTCTSGQVVAESWRCDLQADCDDGSDEVGCDWFVCDATNLGIPPQWQCDGLEDCLDGSDEVGCAHLICP